LIQTNVRQSYGHFIQNNIIAALVIATKVIVNIIYNV